MTGALRRSIWRGVVRTLAVAVSPEAGTDAAAAFRQSGLQRLQASDCAGAAEFFRRSLALEPNDPHAQLHLGIALQGAGRHVEALAALTAAQKALPNDAAPFLHAAISLLALGNVKPALRAARMPAIARRTAAGPLCLWPGVARAQRAGARRTGLRDGHQACAALCRSLLRPVEWRRHRQPWSRVHSRVRRPALPDNRRITLFP